jgi:hypothetical protein
LKTCLISLLIKFIKIHTIGLPAPQTIVPHRGDPLSALRCGGAAGYSPLDRQSKLTAGTKRGGRSIIFREKTSRSALRPEAYRT